MVETPTIDKYMRIRAIASRRAFRELYQQHKLWLKAYKHGDMANLSKLAQDRDAKAEKVLKAYQKADNLLQLLNGMWEIKY